MGTARFILAALCCAWLYSCAAGYSDMPDRNVTRAAQTLDSLYKYYSMPGTALLRETYPFTEEYTATYLASEEQVECPREFAFMWPATGTFSAVNALYGATGSETYLGIIVEKVLPGLEEYYDAVRSPSGYSSYITSAPMSDRYYDDNIWLGIDFVELYTMTGREEYLAKAMEIWRFVESGWDEALCGGVYWCEQSRSSKNACSNAPAAVLALKLYQSTADPGYLSRDRDIYQWIDTTLKDSSDGLVFDHITPSGTVDTTKYSYNSGQMMQAAALLYSATGEEAYLMDARRIAESCCRRFARDYSLPGGRTRTLVDNGANIWFTAVMVRGFCELYRIDRDRKYIDFITRSLDHAWEYGRDGQGLFGAQWDATTEGRYEKWLLNQAAMVEMMARVGKINTEMTK